MTPGPWLDTAAYALESRVAHGGDAQARGCHSRGEEAREDDGAGVHAGHVTPREGLWALRRAWLRPPRGLSQEHGPLEVGFLALVHPARRRGHAFWGPLLERLLT
jgi:transposase